MKLTKGLLRPCPRLWKASSSLQILPRPKAICRLVGSPPPHPFAHPGKDELHDLQNQPIRSGIHPLELRSHGGGSPQPTQDERRADPVERLEAPSSGSTLGRERCEKRRKQSPWQVERFQRSGASPDRRETKKKGVRRREGKVSSTGWLQLTSISVLSEATLDENGSQNTRRKP